MYIMFETTLAQKMKYDQQYQKTDPYISEDCSTLQSDMILRNVDNAY